MYLFSWCFALFCSLILPLTLAVELCVRKKGTWRPLLCGALTFTVFQGFVRLPVLTALARTDWYSGFETSDPALYALFLGATAALFEEGGRWLVMHIFLKKRRSVRDGIAFGAGHGGIEAIAVLGVTALANIIGAGSLSVGEWSLVLAGGAERLFALAAQIGFSVMVMESVREKKPLWLLLAFALHMLIDFGAAYAAGFLCDSASVWALEVCIGLFGAGMLRFTWKAWKQERAQSGPSAG